MKTLLKNPNNVFNIYFYNTLTGKKINSNYYSQNVFF